MPNPGDVHSCPDCGDWIAWHAGFPDRPIKGYWIDEDADPWPPDEEVPAHHRRYLPHPCLRYLVTGIGAPVAEPDDTPYVEEYVPAPVMRRTDGAAAAEGVPAQGRGEGERAAVPGQGAQTGMGQTNGRPAARSGRDPKPLKGSIEI